MRPFPCLLASALLVALVAPAAWARGDDMFKLMDGNNDGRISTQEHDAGAAAMFARMDANHDGMLDAGEMGPRMRHEGGMHGGGMHGGDRVTNLFWAHHLKLGERLRYRAVTINGEPGLLRFIDGQLESAIAAVTDGERIVAFYSVRNPDKLARIAATPA